MLIHHSKAQSQSVWDRSRGFGDIVDRSVGRNRVSEGVGVGYRCGGSLWSSNIVRILWAANIVVQVIRQRVELTQDGERGKGKADPLSVRPIKLQQCIKGTFPAALSDSFQCKLKF